MNPRELEINRRRLAPGLAAVAVAALYFGAAKLGLSLAHEAEQVTAVWPPSGIALAAMLLLGYRVWPAIFLGAFLANVTTHEPFFVAVGIAVGNTLEALAATWLLRRYRANELLLDRVRGILVLIAAVFASSSVAATIGVTSLALGSVQPWSAFGSLWTLWWLGDATGALIATSFLLAIAGLDRSRWDGWRLAEAAVLLLGLVGTGWFLFSGSETRAPLAPAYLIFPFVIWAALRLGQLATTGVVIVTTALVIWGTVRGTGPFVTSEIGEGLRALQLFMVVVAITGLALAAAIAERERVEAWLREADTRKDAFLATLAHELRNPLAPIRNSLAIMDLAGHDAEKVAAARGVIDRQVRQMVRLVDDLLDLSRISRGKIVLRKERVTLATVVESALETTRPSIEAMDHVLTVSLPAAEVTLEADPVRLTQVIANLLANACKYTERGGRISLTAELHGAEVVIAVRDTGIGIPVPMLSRVFDMFAQLDHGAEQAGGGLGIGLTLVRGLVGLHGGSVTAESAGPGRGSEFVVRLPVPAPEPAATPGPSDLGGRDPARGGHRILVADDNRDAADSLGAVLRLLGNEVKVAYDGVEAVEMTSIFKPRIVLLDLGMPRLDGFEAARRIRQQTAGKDVVLVALTGWGQEGDRRRSAEAGFEIHLVKPIAPAALADLLAKAEGRAG